MNEAYLETRELTVGYNGTALLRDICLQIRKGEIVTLIGPNGSGKSTILKTVTRQLEAVRGTIALDGMDLTAFSHRELATRMAVVLTERPRTELMRCWEVAALGRYPYTGHLGLLSPEDRKKVAAAMERTGVLELAERDFAELSDGQRQRVLLARALCQEPELLVLDEPTSYLDIRHKLELLGLLRSMAKESGVTVLLSLHEIDLAEKLSDRLICVRGDTILAFGTPEEIFQPALIDALYDLPPRAFDPLFGSVELPGAAGEPEVFVISGGGTGVPVFRRLQREGIPFAAGVLHENDVDHEVASSLAVQVIGERAFYPVSEETCARAEELMLRCRRVIRTDFPVGPGNQLQLRLVERAGRAGLLSELR